ncbi:MAG: hypothetical protein IOC90_06305 [Methylocystis sp.]|nr:hypothetical protein [Methylocystis sp.]MCA3583163.1 hypothetical protein [Methylocystis sp.]MCA3587632.1 hypothetical protein [Methylocystis sp.]MCA3590759.1 hypothetical protein [Methylocystis sp.]
MDRFSLIFTPFLPWPVIAGLGVAALAVAGLAIFARQRGGWLRLAAFGLMLLALANPAFVTYDRDKLNDVVAVVLDRTGSQRLADRTAQTDRARDEVLRQLNARPGTDIRVIEVDERDADVDGTRLFETLQAGLGDVPPERMAGVIAITDGRVHDVPANARALGFQAPVHALITGREGERDRRLEVVQGPRFGIVGKDVQVAVRVVDSGVRPGAPANVIVRRGGQVIARRTAAPGQIVRVPVRIENAGQNLIEVEAESLPDELTLLNNIAVLPIDGVRDKLKVLLVSGEPHAGERTWRNLLKADGNVELVHFTILRPPEKQDGTPINELALIAFPTRDLFVQKIAEFDLIILDRYANQSILPPSYFENIVRYVREGGAVLLAAGGEFAGPGSLSTTPLMQILPARPVGNPIERPFLPRISPIGERHPVTRSLPGWDRDNPQWAPWFRLVAAQATAGASVMTGPDDLPLLVLNRVQKGRVAQLLSDHAWLWARGLGEGGPYIDLLRRLSHWLMKEPELDEEALRMTARGRVLTIERQTLAEKVDDMRLIGPDGDELKLTLTQAEPGLWRTNFNARRQGLHRVIDGERVAFANVGPPNPREFREVTSTEEEMRAVLEQTGGGVRRVEQSGRFNVPRIVDILGGTRYAGSDFIGLKPADAYIVKGAGLTPLALGLTGLALLLGSIILTWLREGRSRFRRRA